MTMLKLLFTTRAAAQQNIKVRHFGFQITVMLNTMFIYLVKFILL